ncbi:MAG: PAS domain-containing protein, partial [Candidatus Eremiobacteraeota bacterium]|nr:PAS domain-containing protein [Candidatus Eremiobacteraeota bacterium]
MNASRSVSQIIADADWHSGILGPRSQWPASLNAALAICLESRSPIAILWGPQLVVLYNDAYRANVGAALHPAALGRPAIACWPEAWGRLGPILNAVIETGTATRYDDLPLRMNRAGLPAEGYFTLSCSPIRDENGVGGVFCLMAETTARVLRERADRSAEAVRDAETIRARHLRFLSEASDCVLSSLRERNEILIAIAATAVPWFVEWCGVY